MCAPVEVGQKDEQAARGHATPRWLFDYSQKSEQAAGDESDAPRHVLGVEKWFRRKKQEDGSRQDGKKKDAVRCRLSPSEWSLAADYRPDPPQQQRAEYCGDEPGCQYRRGGETAIECVRE